MSGDGREIEGRRVAPAHRKADRACGKQGSESRDRGPSAESEIFVTRIHALGDVSRAILREYDALALDVPDGARSEIERDSIGAGIVDAAGDHQHHVASVGSLTGQHEPVAL